MSDEKCLSQDPIFNSTNRRRVLKNCIQRDRLSRYLATPAGSKSILIGSCAHSAFTNQARLFSDIDLINRYTDFSKDETASRIEKETEFITARNIHFPEIIETVLPKRTSIDGPINIRTPNLEWHLASALLRLYRSISFSAVVHKESFDIWALAQAQGLDMEKVQVAIDSLKTRNNFFSANYTDTVCGILGFKEDSVFRFWDAGAVERPAFTSATPQKVFETIKELTGKLDFKRNWKETRITEKGF